MLLYFLVCVILSSLVLFFILSFRVAGFTFFFFVFFFYFCCCISYVQFFVLFRCFLRIRNMLWNDNFCSFFLLCSMRFVACFFWHLQFNRKFTLWFLFHTINITIISSLCNVFFHVVIFRSMCYCSMVFFSSYVCMR